MPEPEASRNITGECRACNDRDAVIEVTLGRSGEVWFSHECGIEIYMQGQTT